MLGLIPMLSAVWKLPRNSCGACAGPRNWSHLLGAGRFIRPKFRFSTGKSGPQRLSSSPGPLGSVPGSRPGGNVLGDSALLAVKYRAGPSASAGRASQRRIWKGQWIRAVGTVDLDLEIPGGGIMSAAGGRRVLP